MLAANIVNTHTINIEKSIRTEHENGDVVKRFQLLIKIIVVYVLCAC